MFSPRGSYEGAVPFSIGCGQCAACRLAKAGQWATRCVHEASLWEQNHFVTATYAPEFLPADLSVSKRAMQLFLKRVRKEFGPGVRFFLCGEYGERLGRPHYHAILFNLELNDRVLWRSTETGSYLYRSATMERLWPFGAVEVGAVTHESAGYVARYAMKKVSGDRAAEHYRRTELDLETGELRSWSIEPEFLLMSRRPGIGAGWFDRFKSDAFPSDFVVVNGQKVPVPDYYKWKLSESEQVVVTRGRRERARAHAANNTESRLLVRDECSRLRTSRLERSLDAEC